MNVYSGNGNAQPANQTFGVGLFGTSSSNLIERNIIGGNTFGVQVRPTATGNIVRLNNISGNPAIQVSATFGSAAGVDIRDLSPAGSNTFEDNICLTYVGSTAPAPCPHVSKPNNDEDKQERDMAAKGATTPFQRAFPYTHVGRSRLTFPRARPVDAIFRPSGHPFPKAVGSANPGQTAASNSVTVTGKVVDAACYMLHPPAAKAASHKDYGAVCLARGVPLAIAADDGSLYFPADGNQRLKSLLNARVRASGTVVEKHEPMELKMPVGDKNEMVVRVEGGYKQITIQKLEKVSPAKRHPA